MTSWWRFPPNTREVQFDEKWSFVFEKQEHCDPLDPADDQHGDWWDHVALDPERRLVLAVVPGARDAEAVAEVVGEVKGRTGGRVLVEKTVGIRWFLEPQFGRHRPARPGQPE